MGTQVHGTAKFFVDFWTDETLDALGAEEAFNQAILDIYNNEWEFGNADYDQDHSFHVDDGEKGW